MEVSYADQCAEGHERHDAGSGIQMALYRRGRLQRSARTYGFEEIRTPVFEHTELFQRGVGDTTDIVQKEMYTFQDYGKRNITLKPEGTSPAVRALCGTQDVRRTAADQVLLQHAVLPL